MFSSHLYWNGIFCGRQNRLGRQFCFGCHAGELRSGLSGWMHETAEVLELLTFWKRGTAGGLPFFQSGVLPLQKPNERYFYFILTIITPVVIIIRVCGCDPKKGEQMQINLSELIQSEGKVMSIEADYQPNWYQAKGGNYKIVQKKPLQMEFTNLGKKKIRLETEIDLTLQMRCDRCLEPVLQEIRIDVSREFDMDKTDQQRIEALDEINFISGNNLDVERFVYGEVLINLPMKVLCREDCKGLCNRCGANLNQVTCNCDTTELDPRMAKIRDIFQNANR